MTRKMDYGNWAQVIGAYDLTVRKGEIQSMMPASIAFASLPGGEERVRLRGLDQDEAMLFDLAVNPLTPSCGVVGERRVFEEYVPVTPKLATVRLYIDGVPAADYAPGSPEPRGQLEIAPTRGASPYRLPIEGDVEEEPGVSYVVQARPDGDRRWHTLAAGLLQPKVQVDINQFPGAKALDVRVLRTNGLETSEVLHERRVFGEVLPEQRVVDEH